MSKEYYVIKTFMNFEKTVLVPCDEVFSVAEARQLVSDAVESCEIDLMISNEPYADEEWIDNLWMENEENSFYQIIHKEDK